MFSKSKVLTPVLLLAISLVFAQNAFSFGAKEIKNEKIAVKFAREVIRGNYGIVSTDELKKWVDNKKEMLIVDTMPLEASYVKQHIPTALQFEFPIPEMTKMEDAEKAGFLEFLGPDKDRLIVMYCGFTKCARSHNGAMWAKKLGYTNVVRCPGGIKGWAEQGYPVEKGN